MNESSGVQESRRPLSEQGQATGATPGVIDSARAWAESVAMLSNRVLRLTAVEGRLAGKSLGMMLVLGSVGVLLLSGGWLFLIAAAAVALASSGFSWFTALLLVSVIQFALCAAAFMYAAKRRRHLRFEATRRQLNMVRERYASNP